VLEPIAVVLKNREITRRLLLSEGSVKTTVSETYTRLNVRDRVAMLKRLGQRPAMPG